MAEKNIKEVRDSKFTVDIIDDSDDSDTTQEVNHMDFSRILIYLKAGAKVRRESWSGNKSIFLAKDIDDMLPFICINTKDGHKGVYSVTACDLLAEDWIVIKT